MLLMLFMGIAASTWAGSTGNAVEVQVRSDSGGIVALYAVAAGSPNRKVYAEAVKGDQYSIFVRNLPNQRLGLVWR